MDKIDLSKTGEVEKDISETGEVKEDEALEMSSVKDDGAKDVVEAIGGLRSAEAIALAQALDGKIVLRLDGLIDIPELDIKGMGRLSVEGPTDLSDPENALVQGDHVDQYRNKGVPGISYMTGRKAKTVAKEQGKKLFSASKAEAKTKAKTKAFLDTLGTTGAKKSQALQALFGSDFSGYWDPNNDGWSNVDSCSYVGVSEEASTDGLVSSIEFDSSDTNQFPAYEFFPHPFLACEDC